MLEIDELLIEAHKYWEDGYLEKAIEVFTTIYSEGFREEDFLINYALCYSQNGDYEKSKELFYELLKINSNNPTAYYGLGTIYDDLKDYDKAIEFYQEAISIDSSYYTAHFFLANIYEELGNISLAIHNYKRAIELCPTYFWAYMNLGTIYEKTDNDEKARELFSRAINVEEHHLAYFNRAVTNKKLGYINEAIDDYMKSLDISTEYPYTYLNLALIYKDYYEDIKKAIYWYTKGIELYPDVSVLFYNRACSYALINELEKSVKDLGAALNLSPSLFEYMIEDKELNVLRDRKDYKEVIENACRPSI